MPVNIEGIVSSGLCTQCGTCVALCPRGAIATEWSLRSGYLMRVDPALCNDCGICVDVCPGEGLDFTRTAWWREENEGAPFQDFLGPWRRLHIGWASDEQTRYQGASGGLATAILQGAFAHGLIDAAIVCRMDPENPLRVQSLIARTAEEIAECRGSKYNVAATNTLLCRVLNQPGRYALVGLPCHIQGLRLAQARNERLRERVAFTLGIFCASSFKPRATEVETLRAGLDPRQLARVSYRGPGWPGPLHLETRAGDVSESELSAYFTRFVRSSSLPRCRLCPDALSELADLSVGDTWLPRYEGTPGVSDLVIRTPRGERLIDTIAPDWLTLRDSTSAEILQTQEETRQMKRDRYRGRMWLRRLSGRPIPRNPGIAPDPSLGDIWLALKDLAGEARGYIDGRRYPSRG
ncbi:MAG: Coenzyme F420 hydrogenase/dehydrogenase, beta subunit C-terminal domain [Thermoleophilia bacterium]